MKPHRKDCGKWSKRECLEAIKQHDLHKSNGKCYSMKDSKTTLQSAVSKVSTQDVKQLDASHKSSAPYTTRSRRSEQTSMQQYLVQNRSNIVRVNPPREGTTSQLESGSQSQTSSLSNARAQTKPLFSSTNRKLSTSLVSSETVGGPEARAAFEESFPRVIEGARHVVVETPSTDFQCMLYAIRLSIKHQYPHSEVPTIVDLHLICDAEGIENKSWLSDEEGNKIVSAWSDRPDSVLNLRLGIIQGNCEEDLLLRLESGVGRKPLWVHWAGTEPSRGHWSGVKGAVESNENTDPNSLFTCSARRNTKRAFLGSQEHNDIAAETDVLSQSDHENDRDYAQEKDLDSDGSSSTVSTDSDDVRCSASQTSKPVARRKKHGVKKSTANPVPSTTRLPKNTELAEQTTVNLEKLSKKVTDPVLAEEISNIVDFDQSIDTIVSAKFESSDFVEKIPEIYRALALYIVLATTMRLSPQFKSSVHRFIQERDNAFNCKQKVWTYLFQSVDRDLMLRTRPTSVGTGPNPQLVHVQEQLLQLTGVYLQAHTIQENARVEVMGHIQTVLGALTPSTKDRVLGENSDATINLLLAKIILPAEVKVDACSETRFSFRNESSRNEVKTHTDGEQSAGQVRATDQSYDTSSAAEAELSRQESVTDLEMNTEDATIHAEVDHDDDIEMEGDSDIASSATSMSVEEGDSGP